MSDEFDQQPGESLEDYVVRMEKMAADAKREADSLAQAATVSTSKQEKKDGKTVASAERDKRLADAKRAEREAALERERIRAESRIIAVADELDKNLSPRQVALKFSEIMLPDMLHVIAEVALNRFENGTTRVNAAETLIIRAAGKPRETVADLNIEIAELSLPDAADKILRMVQAGQITMEESKGLLALAQAKNNTVVQTLEEKLVQLETAVERLSGGGFVNPARGLAN